MTINWSVAAGIVLLAQGLLFAFVGYRVLRTVLAMVGFVAGAVVTYLALHSAQQAPHVVAIAAVLAGAIVGALLAFPLYVAGLFLQGAGAFALTFKAFGLDEPPLLVGLAALCGGLLAVVFRKVVLVLATALEGSFSVVYGVQFLIGAATLGEHVDGWGIYGSPLGFSGPVFAIAVAAVFVVGAAFQFRDLRQERLLESEARAAGHD